MHKITILISETVNQPSYPFFVTTDFSHIYHGYKFKLAYLGSNHAFPQWLQHYSNSFLLQKIINYLLFRSPASLSPPQWLQH